MLKVVSQIEKFESRADNTWKLIIGTQELDESHVAELAMLKGKLGTFVFAVDESIKEEDIPTGPVEFKDDLTLDERFNKVLYAYHMAKTNDSKTFHVFKRSVYEHLFEIYREKIAELK